MLRTSFASFHKCCNLFGNLMPSVLEEKSSFKVLTFSSKLDWGSYIFSVTKSSSKKIRTLIWSMEFLSHEVAMYLCKCTIRPCMEYYCHIWAGTTSCCLLTTKMDMQDSWPLTYCLSWTLGLLSKCSWMKSFLYVLPW